MENSSLALYRKKFAVTMFAFHNISPAVIAIVFHIMLYLSVMYAGNQP